MTKEFRLGRLLVTGWCLMGVGSTVTTAQVPGSPPAVSKPTTPAIEAPVVSESPGGKVAPENVSESGEKTLPSGIGRRTTDGTTIFHLKNANAAECARILKELLGLAAPMLAADPRTNSLLITNADKDELVKFEDLLKLLDETPSNLKPPIISKQSSSSGMPGAPLHNSRGMMLGGMAANSPAHVDTASNPEARKLADQLSQTEKRAAELAKQVRIHLKQPGVLPSNLDLIRKELDETLTSALAIKFKLEQLQLNALEERITHLKVQMAQRSASAKQIVERRARELIEEDALKWTPNQPDSANELTAKGDEPAQSADDSPKDDPSMVQGGPLTSGRVRLNDPRDQKPADSNPLQTETVAPRSAISNYQTVAEELLESLSNASGAEEELKKMRQLYENKVVPEQALVNAIAVYKLATLKRNLAQQEYAATMRDLELQVAAGQDEVNSAEKRLEHCKSLGASIEQTGLHVDRLRKAELSLARLKLRHDLYKKAGEATGTNSPGF